MITPENICRHELIGLEAAVERSTNPSQEGISGRIADETRNMLVIFSGVRLKAVQKKGAVFRMRLPDDTQVRVDGSVLVTQPEKRISMRIRKPR